MISKFLMIGIGLIFISSIDTIKAQDKPVALSNFIEKKREHNKHSKTGYSVVLYNGNETKALEIYNNFKENFEKTEIKLTYVSPDWKVLTPAYYSKLEAEKVYLLIKEIYPNAKIL